MNTLAITHVSIASLKPAKRNARLHSKKQLLKLAASISAFSFLNPVLIDGDNRIICGHARVEAAKLLNITEVPVICVDHLSAQQLRAYAIAENQLHDLSEWSDDILAAELSDLDDLNFDLTVTGFDTAEVDILLSAGALSDDPIPDELPLTDIARDKPSITQPGDVWQIGKNRIICGNALAPNTYAELLGCDQAQMIITDPPYNVPINGHVSGLGKNKHEEFVMASGEMDEVQFTRFLKDVMKLLTEYSVNGSIHFVFMDFRHIGELLNASRNVYSELKNLCVWSKTNAGMGSLYRSQHELIFVFKSGKSKHINNVELGKHGRSRTNVWRYAGANTFGKNRDEDLACHPTVKPVDLISDAIMDCSNRGGIILDAFLGSGTTIIAAEKTGRRGYGIEIDPYYVDAALRRISAATGIDPVHIASNMTFAQRSQMPNVGGA